MEKENNSAGNVISEAVSEITLCLYWVRSAGKGGIRRYRNPPRRAHEPGSPKKSADFLGW